MYNLIPLFLILISLSVIISIVVRKFSALASLDVDSIPAEKEAKFKEQIVAARLRRNLEKFNSLAGSVTGKFFGRFSAFIKSVYHRLLELKEDYVKQEIKEKIKKVDNRDERLSSLFAEVSDLIGREEFDTAEAKLIEIISLDSKSQKAFRMLGGVYYRKKNYQEAKETYKHVLKLAKNKGESSWLAETNFDLALAAKAASEYDEALEGVRAALDFEPNNPRYLDTVLEISIIRKDKDLAEDVYRKLAEANPENNKLGEFRKQIDEL